MEIETKNTGKKRGAPKGVPKKRKLEQAHVEYGAQLYDSGFTFPFIAKQLSEIIGETVTTEAVRVRILRHKGIKKAKKIVNKRQIKITELPEMYSVDDFIKWAKAQMQAVVAHERATSSHSSLKGSMDLLMKLFKFEKEMESKSDDISDLFNKLKKEEGKEIQQKFNQTLEERKIN
ncbi:MAG: hypothetical protein QXT97_02590 [Candidatus Diapherotrites archaeon]